MAWWSFRALLVALALAAGAAPAFAQAAEGITLGADGANTAATLPPAAPAARTGATAAAGPLSLAAARPRIEALERELFGACTQNDRVISRLSGGAAPVRLTGERQMQQGGITVYRYTYRATGCGRAARRHNIEVRVRQGAEPLVLMLPVGTSVMNGLVYQGVFQSVFAPGFSERYPNCQARQLRILEANVAGGSPYVAGQSWQEAWRYDACGSRGQALITFNYDGSGLRMEAQVNPGDATVTP